MPQVWDVKDLYKDFVKLTDEDQNRELYRKIISSDPDDISIFIDRDLPPGLRCLRVETPPKAGQDLPGFDIALVDDNAQSIIYYNAVVVMNICDLNIKPASQSLIWRSRDEDYRHVLNDFARDVFFNYILPRYVGIVSDGNQSLGGRFFWESQIQAALSKGKNVYYYKMISAELEPIKTKVELNLLKKHIWGDHKDFANNLVIISDADLPLSSDYKIPVVIIRETDRADANKLIENKGNQLNNELY